MKKSDDIQKIKQMLYKTSVGGRIMEDLSNYEMCDGLILTPKRILEELEYTLYKVECDGWENHLENPQQISSLRSLIVKVQKLQKSKCGL